jgi:hypothetical protein
MNSDSIRLFNLAVKSFIENNSFMVGHAIAIAAAKMCKKDSIQFLQ